MPAQPFKVSAFNVSEAERWAHIDAMFAELYGLASTAQLFKLTDNDVSPDARFDHLETMATDLATRFSVIIPFQPFARDYSAGRRWSRLDDLMAQLYAAAAAPSVIAATILGPEVLDPDGSGLGPDANGWTMRVTIAGAAAAIGGVIDGAKMTMAVDRPGFDASGAVTTVRQTFNSGVILRRQAPNDTLKQMYVSGPDLVFVISLEDYVYVADTIVSCTFEAGFYTKTGYVSPAASPTVTKASTYAYPQVLTGWNTFQEQRITAAQIPVELMAFHQYGRNNKPVACVKLWAVDGAGNVGPTVSATFGDSALNTQGQVPEVWSANVSTAGLEQTLAARRQAKVDGLVYPWIGTAPFQISVDGYQGAWPNMNPQNPLYFVNDPAGTYGGAIAYVQQNIVYTALSSSVFGDDVAGRGPALAFDNIASNGALTKNEADPWIGMQLPFSANVRYVTITPVNGFASNAPAAPILEWSDDGAPGSWTAKGSPGTAATWVYPTPQTFDFGAGGSAHAYWRIRRAGGSAFLGIGEMAFATTAGGRTVTSGQASLIDAEAAAAPFATPDAAAEAIRVFNNTASTGHTDTHNDHCGGTIFLKQDDGSGHKPAASFVQIAGGVCPLIVRKDPAAGTVVMAGNGTKFMAGSMELRGVTYRPAASGFNWLQVDATASRTFLRDVSIDMQNNPSGAVFDFVKHAWARNVTVVGSTTGNAFGNLKFALASGVIHDTRTAYSSIVASVVVGCRFHKVAPNMGATSDYDGSIMYNNLLWDNGNYEVTPYQFDLVRGQALFQNLIETTTDGLTNWNMSADGRTNNVQNILDVYNHATGERASRAYTDVVAAAGKRKIVTSKFSIWHNWNTKNDSHAYVTEGPGRAVSWRHRFGVDQKGNVSKFGSRIIGDLPTPNGGDGYLGDKWHSSSTAKIVGLPYVTVVADKGNPTLPSGGVNPVGDGTGKGDYRLTGAANAAYGRVPPNEGMLGKDLAGFPRRTNGVLFGAAGPYEQTV